MQLSKTTRLALLGQAVGDAFGSPFEYNSRAPEAAVLSIQERRYLDAVEDCGGKLSRARVPGLYTDDTQQALALLYVRGMRGGPDLFRWVLRSTDFGRGTGRNFREFLRTGQPVPTAGLGAVMRIGPVATTFDDLNEMIRWVLAVSAVTTSHPVALAVAARFAAIVWAFTQDSDRPHVSVDWPTDRVPEEVWLATNKALTIMYTEGERALLDFARSTGWADKEMSCAANGFGLTGYAWAVSQTMKATSFEDALLRVCSSGGDTDTVGAMAGCLAALRFGQIPKWMVDGLVGWDPESWTPANEEVLTELEEDYRRGLLL